MDNIVYDGRTKTNINNLPEEAWTYLRGEGEDGGLKELQKRVPWLYQGMNIRAQGVASVPFAIYKGETEIDISEDWQNKVDILPDPKRIIKQIEMALTLFNYGYLAQPKNPYGFAKELRYLFPLSMRPLIDEKTGLTGFERKLRGKVTPMKIEEVVYFWGIDPYVEIGHPQSSPATAAMAAAGVLMNVDEFAAAFFQRGAIKATILSVPHGTQWDDKEKLESWYTRAVNGIKNAWATKVLNADAVTATVIGEGVKELENTLLTKEKREDISTALGIPQSKLFSTSATDSNREEDEKSFLKDLIVPEAEFIAEVLNIQVFNDMGFRFKFRPEKMDAFQEDETDRSAAFLNYVSATGKDKASIWVQTLGIDLPDGVKPEDLNSDPVEMQPPQEMREGARQNDAKEDEKGKFHRYAKNGRDIDKFTFNFLSISEQEALKAKYAVPETDKLLKSLTDSLDALRSDSKED